MVPTTATVHDDEDQDDEEMDYNVIRRCLHHVHESGMMFDLEEKRYVTWVSNVDEDFRALYYLQNKAGMFKLAVRGEMGANNIEVLDEQN